MDLETIRRILTILAGGGILFGLIGGLVNWIRLERFNRSNRRANVEVCTALACWKDPQVDYLPQGRSGGAVYHITFHTDGGDIVTLYMGPQDYYTIPEGARGKLTWQGEKLWKFEQEV